MKALILGAGQGTRLRPITDDKPKCMVPFNGKPLIEWQEIALRSAGITDIAVVGGYCANVISDTGRYVISNPRFAETNMVESLFCAREWLQGNEDIIISYGDIVCQPNIIQALVKDEADVSVVVDLLWRELWSARMENPLSDAETLKLGPNNELIELGKKPTSYEDIEGQYIGLIKIKSEAIDKVFSFYDDLDRGKEYDGQSFDQMYMTSFIQGLCDNNFDVKASPISGGWIEIDSVEDLSLYEGLSEAGTLSKYLQLNLF